MNLRPLAPTAGKRHSGLMLPPSITERYRGSLRRAILLAPPLAALPALGSWPLFVYQSLLSAAAVDEARHAALYDALPSLLTLEVARFYLMTLAAVLAGILLILLPLVLAGLRWRWPLHVGPGIAAFLGLAPWGLYTVWIMISGGGGSPSAGAAALSILAWLMLALCPYIAVRAFLRLLDPLDFLAAADPKWRKSDVDRMPFAAQMAQNARRDGEDD